jgi:signal peptidase II
MKKSRLLIRNFVLTCILACTIGCDQMTKTIVRKEMSDHQHIKLIYDRLTLTKVENSGAFLSIGDTFPSWIRFLFLSLLPLFVLGFGLYFLLSRSNIGKAYTIGLCFVLGGGIGNLYDRLVHGSVTDFMHIDFGIFQTGIFNVADLAIMTGMGMILFQLYLGKKQINTSLS